MKFDVSHAITELYTSAKYVLRGVHYSGLEWYDERPKPTEEEIQAKITELEAAEPLRLLRIERNRILQQSDWRDLPSYPGTDQEAWRTYRQALRDITETQTPELDEFGNLTNITWPEEPA